MVLKWLPLLLLLTGCEAIQTRASSDTDRAVRHDCNLTLPDGTYLQCGHRLEHDVNQNDTDSGVSVVLPVPAAGK